ncbi:nuclear transport factor 2 family protein [Alkalicoccus halolimnae]|uniref:Nuclear transport factor 2 family protein n=1 Tax=Alkalicoccus halolimnae TaxID=1667239 RepID=A0A5C7F947_9BACI|nr:nuclear transport factor 2 family protein [Alkalicoccus halolimnae]TXF86130.1 nuclear transport factor 2 family protein [Alkalicoccus halolimnae]
MDHNADLIQAFNEAFATNDISFIADNITEDVVWKMAGEEVIRGKQEVLNLLNSMGDNGVDSIEIENIIINGTSIACNGRIEMRSAKGKVKIFEYCDVYKLDKETDGKIKELTSYVVEAVSDESKQ